MSSELTSALGFRPPKVDWGGKRLFALVKWQVQAKLFHIKKSRPPAIKKTMRILTVLASSGFAGTNR